MKYICLALLAFSLNASAQTPIQADPAVGALNITDLSGVSIDASLLSQNQAVLLHVPIYNTDPVVGIPPLTINYKVQLGSKAILDPTYNLASTPLSAYFSWTYAIESGQAVITGVPIATIPNDFIGIEDFRIIPNVLNNSTISVQINIVNNNPSYNFGDPFPANNFTSLFYNVIATVPVDITKVNVLRKGCNINVNFFTENEINVHHYEIESSKDGINFVKVGEVTAASRSSYMKDFALTNELKAMNIFVRIKSVDLNGQYKYSDVKSVSGLCDAALEYNIYPNPVKGKDVAIRATSGMFNGKYNVTVFDISGKQIAAKQVMLQNLTQYNFDMGNVSKGKYILKIRNLDGSDSASLPFEKL